MVLRSDDNPQELKPTKDERDKIEHYLKRPNLGDMKIDEEMRLFLWRFRYTLIKDKNSLTKFLHAVNWTNTKVI